MGWPTLICRKKKPLKGMLTCVKVTRKYPQGMVQKWRLAHEGRACAYSFIVTTGLMFKANPYEGNLRFANVCRQNKLARRVGYL